MLDIKFVRENPEIVKQNMRNKFQDNKIGLVDDVLKLDAELRSVKKEVEALRANRNAISKKIGGLMAQGKKEEAEELKKEVTANSDRLAELDAKEKELEKKVRDIMKIAQEPVSLETPIGEEEDSHLGDFIEDDSVLAPQDAATFTMLREQLIGVLDSLTPREQKVLRLRFGLDDGRARTLEEVGKEFDVTRERIRQIEAKALRKLRHPSRSKKLKDFLE